MIHVIVTAEDIRQGLENIRRQKRDPQTTPGMSIAESCPVALALRRSFPLADKITWGFSNGWVDKYRLIGPPEVAHFVYKMDHEITSEPIEFDVRVFDFLKEI